MPSHRRDVREHGGSVENAVLGVHAHHELELAAVLLVDGDDVTTDADKLAKVTVTAEVLGEERGPKIVIQKFKNKTGYKKRQGHRQDLTRVKVTGIK